MLTTRANHFVCCDSGGWNGTGSEYLAGGQSSGAETGSQGRLLWWHDVGDPVGIQDHREDKPVWWTRSSAGSEGLRLFPQAGRLGEEGYRVLH